MAAYDDDEGNELDSTTGINGVSSGGTGANMSATGGTGHFVTQSTAGGSFSTSTIGAAQLQAMTSAELRGILSDETGAGAAVFADTPTILTPTIASFTNATHNHTNAAGGGQLTIAAHSDSAGGTIAFSAGNFTASAGNWTVDSGDQTAQSYTRFGNQLTMHFEITSTDVSATPANLRIAFPNSYVAASSSDGTYWYRDNGGTWTVGLWRIGAGNGYVELYKDPLATAWSTTASDNTSVRGTCVGRIT